MSIHKVLLRDRNRLLPVFILLITFLLAPRLVAQYINDVTFPPQGFVLTQLSGQGITGAVESSIANLAAANPALMAEYKTVSAGVSLQAETKIKPGWIADIGYRRPPKRFVQSGGVVLPIKQLRKQLRIGLGYFQKFSAETLFDSMQIRTTYQPEGTGEFVKPYMHAAIDAWTVSGAIMLRRLLADGDLMSAGFSLHLNSLDYLNSAEGWWESHSEDARQFTIAAGLLYASPKTLFCRATAGIHYEQGVDIRGTGRSSGPEEKDGPFGEVDGQFDLAGRTPSRLYTGIKVELGQRLSLTTGNNWVTWEEVRDNVIDQHEYSYSLAFRWSSSLTTTMGAFSTDMIHSFGGYFSLPHDSFKATYLIFGLSKQLGPLSLDAVIADSHRNSGAWIEQTILKLGLGVHL
jgi:hypothetical protein